AVTCLAATPRPRRCQRPEVVQAYSFVQAGGGLGRPRGVTASGGWWSRAAARGDGFRRVVVSPRRMGVVASHGRADGRVVVSCGRAGEGVAGVRWIGVGAVG